jgi:D-apiose dehydrogenase
VIRVAIIGLGAAARNIHLPAYRLLAPRVSLVGGCDPDPAAREEARKRWGLPAVWQTPEEMLEQAMPEVVSVCTPPALHRDHCLLAMRSGCHVFCEKPLAEDLSQADEIIAASDETRRLVAVNTQFPSMKIYSAAKRLIGSPVFGRLLFLQACQTFRPTELTEAGWRGQLERRVCFEFGIHVFELVRYFFEDDPMRIFAHMPNPAGRSHFDVLNLISVEFSDGRAASIILNRLSKGPERYLDLRLDGEFASIATRIGGEAHLAAGFHTAERRPFLDLNWALGGKAVLRAGNRSKVIAREGINPFADATANHFKNFLDAIQSGAAPPGNARDNRKTLALVFAAYDSAQSGKSVELSQFQNPRPGPGAKV